mgnify:CR=1 FL=1
MNHVVKAAIGNTKKYTGKLTVTPLLDSMSNKDHFPKSVIIVFGAAFFAAGFLVAAVLVLDGDFTDDLVAGFLVALGFFAAAGFLAATDFVAELRFLVAAAVLVAGLPLLAVLPLLTLFSFFAAINILDSSAGAMRRFRSMHRGAQQQTRRARNLVLPT